MPVPTPRQNRRPMERFLEGFTPVIPSPSELSEAFRWSVTRRVTKTATVSACSPTVTRSAPSSSAGRSSCASTPKTWPKSTSTTTA